MNITFKNLQEAIDKAKSKDACDRDIHILKSFKSINEFLNHAKAPFWLYWYASNVIHGRWSEAEEWIRTDPEWAYFYAQDVIQGRWSEAEDVIRTDPEWAYRYARDLIQGRWTEAEDVIKTHPSWADYYTTLHRRNYLKSIIHTFRRSFQKVFGCI